ncbi:MAG TPA: hypothetical protein VHZ74_17235 [Bryobacteraceae bacterium]|nr:hypothetical protein [Bryobacteraceae bacterium]
MLKFLIWCILFVMCWPLALMALALYPIVWMLLLPFRFVGIAVAGVLALIWALVMLPARVMSRVL